ncbi:dephospho-CoA kinase [Flagellimonas allohymeniacidonis]|uniref:Dephospho-CoA kinase n=1 Tax=Flagellimonas allohymeniacidonis TaxID=2517819 RepID=A0A4Q8QF23_9FLAO|nr:dephospho-CoA kinase [Allomuricauda hymeniacidonis]TAI49061.1 dephospho-CoA kinase [Allomuricauda hymeniacidonis]
MKVVGLTGGIGSGKSTVAKMFKELGVPVYDSDYEAKRLMVHSKKLKEQIKDLLGNESYLDGNLNRPYIARRVFTHPDLLQSLNAIVHPAVREDFESWSSKQDAPYVIQETALIFEKGIEDYYDSVILITAPKDFRLDRVAKRDGLTKADVLQRMKNQMEDEGKMEKAHFVIENIDLDTTLKKVKETHESLVKLAN